MIDMDAACSVAASIRVITYLKVSYAIWMGYFTWELRRQNQQIVYNTDDMGSILVGSGTFSKAPDSFICPETVLPCYGVEQNTIYTGEVYDLILHFTTEKMHFMMEIAVSSKHLLK